MKKYIFFLLVLFGVSNHIKSYEMPTRSLSFIVATAASIKAAYDLYYQQDAVAKVAELYAKVQPFLPTDLTSQFQLHKCDAFLTQDLCLEIIETHSWLDSTYNSMFLPWNWTASQKQAFESIDMITKYMLYVKFAVCDFKPESIVALCKVLYTAFNKYPLIDAAQTLKYHIDSLRAVVSDNNIAMMQLFIDVQNILLSSVDYRLEHFQKQLDRQSNHHRRRTKQ